MGKKKAGSTGTPTVEYHLSSHLGYCIGPVDAIHQVKFRDKWLATNVYRDGVARIDVDERELFGGPKKEGGVHGSIWFLPGREDQVLPPALAAKLGSTPDQLPGFRGLASIFLVGNGWNNQPGFYQGSQLPQVTVPEVRMSKGAWRLGTPHYLPPSMSGGTYARQNVNAAAAIWECLTDTDWGMGANEQSFKKETFLAAAETLYNEKFGITIWQGQQFKVEELVADILDHIDGMFFFDPRTGKGELKLLRNDYNVDELEVIGPDVAKMVNFRRKLWGETTNEIVVEWINPENEETETVTYQNLANIAMQGEVVSETKQYHFIRDPELASTVAAREISRASQPLATCQLEVHRMGWKLKPGDVVKLNWPKYDIENLVMRIMEVDYGTVTDSKLKVTMMEDIFGLGYAKYVEPPPSEWVPSGTEPEPLEVMTLSTPKPIIDRFYTLTDTMYPDVTPAFLAWSPHFDQNTFNLYAWDMQLSGNMGWTGLGTRSTIGKTGLLEPWVQEVSTEFVIGPVIGGISPTEGSIGVVGNLGTDDYGAELVMFVEKISDTNWRVLRGLWDTVPQEWPFGTELRILTQSFNAMDFSERLAFTDQDYKLQTISSLRTLDFENETPVMTANVPDRPYLPFRPANVKVGGVMFGTLDLSDPILDYRRTSVDITWSNRHRDTEDTVPRHWDEADMAPELGQTTEVVILDKDKQEVHRITGLTGTSYTLDYGAIAALVDDPEMYVKLVSRRAGLESLQGIAIRVKFEPHGFGYGYGLDYGGWQYHED